jgi:AraC family transcriptional regulator, L-rhamnose operon regulatory protein RhaS
MPKTKKRRSRLARTVAREQAGARLPVLESSRDGERDTYLWPDTHLRAVPHLGRVRYRRALPELPPHRHENAYEICFLREGNLTWEIDGHPVLLAPGEVLVLAPSAEHGGARSMMERCRMDFLQINVTPGGTRLAGLVSALAATAARPRAAGAAVGEAFDRVLAEVRRRDRWVRAGVEAAVASLLVAVLRAHEEGAAGGGAFSEPVARVVRHFEQSPADWPTVHALERVAGLGATQLQERFRRETGLSLNAYALERRLARAKILIGQGRGSAEVAKALGFSSSQYFATAFKRHVGVTPKAFALTA